MLQGTGSDVGKSLLVAGLCRLFRDRGLAVRPFKPQNMSNNAAVTADGGEIGRAQALQARAAGVAPSVDMNPVLLKPESERGAQVIVCGRRTETLSARDYVAAKPRLMSAVLESFRRLQAEADLIVVEGAGSPAEVNLRAGDIANMGFAEAANVPVVLVADIDRGGVIASIVGTHAVLSEAERRRIKGFVVNKFRGDPTLFDDGLAVISDRTGWPSLGLVPHFPAALKLPAEDAMVLDRRRPGASGATRIAVPRLGRIANFDDFDPLSLEPEVAVDMVAPGRPLPGDADMIVLPGSKSTIGDLADFRAQGWDIDLAAYVRRGGRVLGICGGYQMLGRTIHDPEGIEGPAGSVAGLGLLDVETTLIGDKALVEVSGVHRPSGRTVTGYEMHLGRTQGPDTARPMLDLDGRQEGALSADGRIAGCYLHGLFAADDFRRAWLADLGAASATEVDFEAEIEQTLDALAAHLEAHVAVDEILRLARER
ncbi:MAG: cobyric acid synthase [Alphaproteobacteria bacterium]|nr:cobyric acid synthase [Alphaproteobacteria bacterium]